MHGIIIKQYILVVWQINSSTSMKTTTESQRRERICKIVAPQYGRPSHSHTATGGYQNDTAASFGSLAGSNMSGFEHQRLGFFAI